MTNGTLTLLRIVFILPMYRILPSPLGEFNKCTIALAISPSR